MIFFTIIMWWLHRYHNLPIQSLRCAHGSMLHLVDPFVRCICSIKSCSFWIASVYRDLGVRMYVYRGECMFVYVSVGVIFCFLFFTSKHIIIYIFSLQRTGIVLPTLNRIESNCVCARPVVRVHAAASQSQPSQGT